MKNFIIGVASATAILLLTITLTVSAQNIQENTLKTNIVSIDNPLEKIQSLEPINYSHNTKKLSHLKLSDESQYGFKIESAKETFPTLIKTKGKSYYAGKNNSRNATFQDVDHENLVPVLVAAIQEQQKAIDQLKKEIEALKASK